MSFNLNERKVGTTFLALLITCLTLTSCQNETLPASLGVSEICSAVLNDNEPSWTQQGWNNTVILLGTVVDKLDIMLKTDGEKIVGDAFNQRTDNCKSEVESLLRINKRLCTSVNDINIYNYCLISVGVPTRPSEQIKIFANPLRNNLKHDRMIERIFNVD